jgi:glycosyltransferase involved in cell wall biosynthesis
MKGVSGIMRVKNDADFIAASIDSCVDALDELVVVYNDCTDNSADVIEQMRQKYPEKIRVFEYPHKVLGVGLTKEEYNIAMSLPDDSPALLCNYYNFALAKVQYEYAIKIDADQIYFSSELAKWCDIVRNEESAKGNSLLGMLFHFYFLTYRFISLKLHKRLPIMPKWLAKTFKPHYESYAVKKMRAGKACLSFSGLNVFKDKSWCVSLGLRNDTINILPPFNGENDHLLFKVSDKTYYRKFDMEYYNLISNSSYSLIEEFVHPYKPMPMGFCWFHMNAMRDRYKGQISSVKSAFPTSFEPIDDFLELDYREVENRSDKQIHSLYQRVMFSYVYNADKDTIKMHLDSLS